FLNRELASVPDIDLDFPRDIREKLILAVHDRFGRERSALIAAFSTYRSRSAIRELGKALGLPPPDLDLLARGSDGWRAELVGEEMGGPRGCASAPTTAASARSRTSAARSPGCRATSPST